MTEKERRDNNVDIRNHHRLHRFLPESFYNSLRSRTETKQNFILKPCVHIKSLMICMSLQTSPCSFYDLLCDVSLSV